MIPKAVAVVLTLAFATNILGQDPTPPKQDPKQESKPDRSETIRKLSRRERKARTAKLEARHQDFVADVTPIILPAELDLFLSLESDQARDAFSDEFWRRRDHMNRTTGVFRDMYYRRLELAKDQFKRVENDQARMFLLHGAPDEVVRSNCQRFLQPTEIWKYEHLPLLGRDVRLLFYKPRHQGDYRLWNPVGGASALNELMTAADAITQQSAEDSRRPAQVAPNTQNVASASPYAFINRIQLECAEGNEIMLAVSQMIQSRVDLVKLFEPPELDAEDVQKIMRSAVVANPNAPQLNTEFSVRFPTKDGSRTDVQMTLLVPRDQLSPAEAGGAEVYTLDVAGEVLKDGQLWEKYRYRFDFPAEVEARKLPIVIDRLLRPNEYVSRIKVTDANTGAEALVENTISVPEIFLPEPEEAAPAVNPAATTTVAELKKEVTDPSETRLRIVPPGTEIVSGLQTIETLATGKSIKAVEFWLDGKKIAVRRSPPFTLDLDFGEVPRMRRIRAVALGADDKAITGDELEVNTGTDPFGIRIVSPRFAPQLAGPARVEMDVRVPDHEKLASVELFWNETRMATLYDAPFVQTVVIPADEGAGYLRAVAHLEGDAPPVEDVVMVNTPAYMEELNVHLVELPTTVLVGGKPTDKLTEKSFKVLDDGKPVPISKFEYVRNLPLSVGMAIDSSGSMGNRMEEAVKAGAQFFQKVLRKGDKAFLVAFDNEPRLMQKWSAKAADVLAGLAKVRAEDKTSLYDAVVYSLYNFHGIRGQRALVVISDGKDTASKFTYDQSLEYARRSGVPIYGIGIGIRSNDADVKFKLDKLCRETGGSTYYIDQARDLQRVYDDIQSELRSQYILGFYPSPDIKPGSKWREVTVQASEGKVKTIKGYFP